MKKEEALGQLDAAIELAKQCPENSRPSVALGTFVTTSMMSTLDRIITPGSSYAYQLDVIKAEIPASYPGYLVPNLLGVLTALKNDVQLGYLQTVSELIHADTFADFLTMAQHLLDEGYKDPAAVVAGSVVEQHLRSLANKNGVAALNSEGRWKKADLLNSDLVKANVYQKLTQKSVTVWLDLRNDAAHGNYANYEAANVKLMIDGVMLYVAQFPA